MKEYTRETYYLNEAAVKINKKIQEGWEVFKIEEDGSFAFVWFVHEKDLPPQLLSEADDLLKPKNQA